MHFVSTLVSTAWRMGFRLRVEGWLPPRDPVLKRGPAACDVCRVVPTVRDQIALWIRTKDLVELGNLYRLRMGIPLLQIKYKLTREQATVLHNTRSAKRALQNGNIDEALAGLRRIEHELIGNA